TAPAPPESSASSAAAPPPKNETPPARPAPAAQAEAPPPAPAPAKPETCDGLFGFSILLCRTEGPQRFWQCAPDGVNWDNDISGCQRDTGNRNRPY
ncbi:MAG: hypothetical protein LBJ59_10955, partial [Zoogloeaceae bacterium]|nr:hypothetical protein [Zoogloeaceae bacterium]